MLDTISEMVKNVLGRVLQTCCGTDPPTDFSRAEKRHTGPDDVDA